MNQDKAHHPMTATEANAVAETMSAESLHQMRTDHAFLRSLISALDDVVWSILPDASRMIFISPSVEKVYGYKPQAFYDSPGLRMDCIHPQDREYVAGVIAGIRHETVIDIDYRISHKSGELRWIHEHIRAVYGDHGELVRIDGVSVDITQHKLYSNWLEQRHLELREAYDQLEEAQNQLLQSEKMASIGQLAAGVAHEINNPIGYVNSNLGTLQKYLNDLFGLLDVYQGLEPSLRGDPQAAATLDAATSKVDLAYLKEDVVSLMEETREGITRVKKIVQSLKDFSHAGSDEDWQMADLRDCMESTLNIVWNEIKYKAEVIKEYEDIPDIECLPSQLNQVFMNLLVNAAQAIDTHGTITLRIRATAASVIVEVSDNGSGIAPEHLSRVFDPFFTTKPVGKGTGLGLPVSYGIVRKHRGTLSVESSAGTGSTFRIELPLKHTAAEHEEMTS